MAAPRHVLLELDEQGDLHSVGEESDAEEPRDTRRETPEEDDAIAPRGLGAFDGYGSRDDDDDADSAGDDDWSAPAASPDARERGFDRDDYSAEDDLCKGVRRMSTTPQKVPERAPFRHYSYRDADERPPAWQRKSAF